jgi:acyl-CoA reductase-like NAD-dependent aldehyde dehydrogenase
MTLNEFTPLQVDGVVEAAHRAFPLWASSEASTRALLLRTLALQLEAASEELVAIADRETSLGDARLKGEVARTAFQLRGFAEEVEKGAPYSVVDDEAIAGAPPQGRPHLLRVRVPLGPVAMFAASNFPFAFSVLGGDTTSALAAGCSVIVKAHPGHPELSRRVHTIARSVLKDLELPLGLIGLVEGASPSVGVHLVRHPRVAAAAFTGSVRGGLALQGEAQKRPRPIPFFGELGSTNPVVILPAAMTAERLQPMAQTLAQSIGMGSGQFCTSPGLILVQESSQAAAFEAALTSEVSRLSPHTMLNTGIRGAYDSAVDRRKEDKHLVVLSHSRRSASEPPAPFLARVRASDFVATPTLHEEVFGPSALLIVAESPSEMEDVLEAVGGSLTVTIWGADTPAGNSELVSRAMHVAGRVLFSGVPTGVAVTSAQHHGGPFPSSTAPSTTSVGYAALDRFLRPVALQDPPPWLSEREGRPL